MDNDEKSRALIRAHPEVVRKLNILKYKYQAKTMNDLLAIAVTQLEKGASKKCE